MDLHSALSKNKLLISNMNGLPGSYAELWGGGAGGETLPKDYLLCDYIFHLHNILEMIRL